MCVDGEKFGPRIKEEEKNPLRFICIGNVNINETHPLF